MRLNQPVEVLFVAPLPERAAQAIHCLRVNYRGHVQRPLVRDNLARGSCVLCLCTSAPVLHRPRKKNLFRRFFPQIYDWKHLYLRICLVRHSVALPQLELHF